MSNKFYFWKYYIENLNESALTEMKLGIINFSNFFDFCLDFSQLWSIPFHHV